MQFCIKGALVMPAGYPGLLLCISFAGFLSSSCLVKSLLPEVFFSYTFHILIIWVLKNESGCFGVKISFRNKCMLNLNWMDSEKYLVLSYFHSLITLQKKTLMAVLVLDLSSEFFPYSEICFYIFFLWLSQALGSVFRNLLHNVLEWHWSVLLSQLCIIHSPGSCLLNSNGKCSED